MSARCSTPEEVWDFLYEFVAHAAKHNMDLKEESHGFPLLFWILCQTCRVPGIVSVMPSPMRMAGALARQLGVSRYSLLDLLRGWAGKGANAKDDAYNQLGRRLHGVYSILQSNPGWYCPHVKHEGTLPLPAWKKQSINDSIVIIAVPQGTAFLRVTPARQWGPVFPYEWSSSVTGEFGEACTEYEGRERAEQSVRTYLRCMTEAIGGSDG